MELLLHTFLTLALYRDEWSASRPGHFTSWQTLRCIHRIKSCVGLRAAGSGLEPEWKNFSSLPAPSPAREVRLKYLYETCIEVQYIYTRPPLTLSCRVTSAWSETESINLYNRQTAIDLLLTKENKRNTVRPHFRTTRLRQFLPGSRLLSRTGEPQVLSGNSREEQTLEPDGNGSTILWLSRASSSLY